MPKHLLVSLRLIQAGIIRGRDRNQMHVWHQQMEFYHFVAWQIRSPQIVSTSEHCQKSNCHPPDSADVPGADGGNALSWAPEEHKTT